MSEKQGMTSVQLKEIFSWNFAYS